MCPNPMRSLLFLVSQVKSCQLPNSWVLWLNDSHSPICWDWNTRSFDTYFMERRVLRKENYVVLSWSPQPALNRVGNHTGKDTAPCAKLYSPLHLPHPALVPVWLLTCQAVCNSSLRALLLLSLSPEGFQQEQMLVLQGLYRLCLKYLSPLFFQFVCHLFVKASIKH